MPTTNRVPHMSLWDFLKTRLIRLHPMVVFGAVLGLLTLLGDPFRVSSLGYGAGRVALVFITSIFLGPYPVMHERGYSLFSLNSPAWSLFWEYVANLVYAIVLYRLSRRWLSVATVIAALVLCFVGYTAGHLWAGFNGKTFWTGAARVNFSFMAGLLVHRSRWIIRSKLGFGSLSVFVAACFRDAVCEGCLGSGSSSHHRLLPVAGSVWARERRSVHAQKSSASLQETCPIRST